MSNKPDFRAAGQPVPSENISSPIPSEPARPWSDEDMAAAKPFALPTVETIHRTTSSTHTHSGDGKTSPAGRPLHG